MYVRKYKRTSRKRGSIVTFTMLIFLGIYLLNLINPNWTPDSITFRMYTAVYSPEFRSILRSLDGFQALFGPGKIYMHDLPAYYQ